MSMVKSTCKIRTMKAKIILLILGLAAPLKEYAQTALNRTIPVSAGQNIEMHFDYPELITVTTWDKNEISIQGQVNINDGENDNAFILESTTSGNSIKLNGHINDIQDLPHRITVMRDGQKTVFRDKSDWEKYKAEHGRSHNSVSMGPDIDIKIEIKVPRNVETSVTSVYGIVEVKNFEGPLTVDATYGAVDASLDERSIGELTAETNFGEIYTNLNAKFDGSATSKDFHTLVSAKPGQGPHYNFGSKYGNVYLRKAGN